MFPAKMFDLFLENFKQFWDSRNMRTCCREREIKKFLNLIESGKGEDLNVNYDH